MNDMNKTEIVGKDSNKLIPYMLSVGHVIGCTKAFRIPGDIPRVEMTTKIRHPLYFGAPTIVRSLWQEEGDNLVPLHYQVTLFGFTFKYPMTFLRRTRIMLYIKGVRLAMQLVPEMEDQLERSADIGKAIYQGDQALESKHSDFIETLKAALYYKGGDIHLQDWPTIPVVDCGAITKEIAREMNKKASISGN